MEPFIESQETEQQISFQDYLRILYRGRWIILFSFLAVLAGTAYFTFTAKPVYEASAKILVESQGSMERALFDINYLNNQSTLITNQVEILKSRTLAERVIQALEAAPYRDSLAIFQPNSDGTYLDRRVQVNWIMNNLEVSPKNETDIIEITFSAGSAFEAAEICNVIAATVRVLNKEFNLSEFKDLRRFLEFQLKKKNEELRKSEDALREFQENRKLVSLDENTKELISRLAESQAQMEAALVELESAQEQKRSLESQLEERRHLLATEVTGISSPLLAELQQEYARMVSEKVKYESLISEAKNIDPTQYQVELKNRAERIQAVRERLEEEGHRISNSSMISDPLQIAQQLIGNILTTETEIKGLTAKIKVLRDVVRRYEGELELLPGQGLALARLQRQVEVDKSTFVLLTGKLEETKIAEAGQKELIRVVDNAIEPRYPISPKIKLNLLLGAVIGLGMGIGLTFLLEFFDDSVKNPDILERMGFSILAIIPKIIPGEVVHKKISSNGHNGLARPEPEESRLVTHVDPKSPISEAYRTLRTNIQFQKLRKNESTLLVTSSAPKEGKSTTISNLAITMAQMGSRTLLVDTDLRRPVVHSIFNLSKDKGITNFLMGKLQFDEVVKPTFVDNLFIVTSGPLPPNPSEIITSEEMDEFIRLAKEKFDVVLFDSPPVIAVTDAAILSTKLDGTILVIKAHQTQQNAIKRAKTLLDNVEANIVGCLLNGVDIERAYGSYYYYYYYHYYSYYGSDLKRRKKASVN